MDNLQAALDAPTALNVTVQAARRREVRRSSRPREYLTEREIDKLMDAASGNRWGHRDATAILLAYRHGQRPPDRWARAARLAPLAAGGAAGALRVHLRAPGAPERGRLPAHGCARWRGGGLPVPDQQPCEAAGTALAPDRFKDFWRD